MKILIVTVSLISLGWCGENSVSINLRNVINTISDNFISVEMDFANILDLYRVENSLEKLSVVSPAYIKLHDLTSYLRSHEIRKHNESRVAMMFRELNALQITPVIVIDYSASTFEPINLLQIMKAARDCEIYEAVWQLGSNKFSSLNVVSSKKYAEDLRTLKIMCESANKEHSMKWYVAADSSVINVSKDKLPFNVKGYESTKLSAVDVITKSNSINFKSQVPVWVTIEGHSRDSLPQRASNKLVCDQECLASGLLHAQVLGDASRKGFEVLFFDEAFNETSSSAHSMKQAISTLHKKLIGSKVFNVRVIKSSQDGKLMKLYSYCSKKTSGAVTMMGINYSNMRAKFNVRLSTPTDSNAVIEQYLLSASDGHVLLNNEHFNSAATPSYKFKKSSKHLISLALPPFSMAYWTVKNVKVDECLKLDMHVKGDEKVLQTLSSSDQLLKKLVANEFKGAEQNVVEKKRRNKRQTGPLLPGFDFEMPAFKFPNLMASASSLKPIRDVFMNKNTEVYKVSPVEGNPLKSSENPLIPEGDVYLLINDGIGMSGSDDDSMAQPKRSKSNRKKNSGNKIVQKEVTEAPDYFIPYDYVDAFHKTAKKATKKVSKQKPEAPREIGELFEAEKPSSGGGRDQTRSSSTNVELKTVIRELEPTYRQSKTAMLAAKRKWDRQQILELLKDAQLEEVDKSQLADTDDFEVIDLTENVESPNYEEYEVDDDGFFDDGLHHIRTRRSNDFAKNEIPKDGEHHMTDEDEDSIESLMDDVHVHMFLPPMTDNREEEKKTITNKTTFDSHTTEAPTVVRAIDFFNKSLNDAINVAHKTMLGWWYVFNPSETY